MFETPDRTPSPGEPLAQLEACHERIEALLATLERLVPHLAERGCDREARELAGAALRYFETEGALHHQDEDHDLFPLLRQLAGSAGRSEIAAAIGELEREHETMERQWRRLRAPLRALAAGGAARLEGEQVMRFAWLYRSHMEREAAAVLPFARQALDAAQRSALGARMAARRTMAG